jgi:hypothetical protein
MASDLKFLFKIEITENFTSEKSVFAVFSFENKFKFPNLKKLQFVKSTKFSKFSQNCSFYSRDLRPKPIFLAGIEELMVPNRDMYANI